VTIPGAGGQVPPRADQAGISAAGQPPGVVVAPGGKPLTQVTQLQVVPGGVLQGIFTYSSNPPAAGTLIETASIAAAGTDKFGNNYLAGMATYSATTATQLNNGLIAFYTGSLAAGWTVASTMQFFSGLILISGGLQTGNNVLDDGLGNVNIAGSAIVSGASLSVGNGTSALLPLNPKIATPPNFPTSGKTLAQTQACLDALITSFQNRDMVN